MEGGSASESAPDRPTPTIATNSKKKNLIEICTNLRIELRIEVWTELKTTRMRHPSTLDYHHRYVSPRPGGQTAEQQYCQLFGAGLITKRANITSAWKSYRSQASNAPCPGNIFRYLPKMTKGLDNCCQIRRLEEPSPMWIRERDCYVHCNWIAIFSYTASLAVSLAIWRGVFRAIGHLVK
jgi:hypothetical protein